MLLEGNKCTYAPISFLSPSPSSLVYFSWISPPGHIAFNNVSYSKVSRALKSAASKLPLYLLKAKQNQLKKEKQQQQQQLQTPTKLIILYQAGLMIRFWDVCVLNWRKFWHVLHCAWNFKCTSHTISYNIIYYDPHSWKFWPHELFS